MRRGFGWFLATILATGALGASRAPAGEPGKDDPPDIDLLLNLDLLKEADLTRDQRVVGRGQLGERLRLLELLKLLDSPAPTAPSSNSPPVTRDTK